MLLRNLKVEFVVTGEIHMSPGVLAAMWKEEETKSRQLEDKMKVLLTNKGVGHLSLSIWSCM